jgi:hypothetical protein
MPLKSPHNCIPPSWIFFFSRDYKSRDKEAVICKVVFVLDYVTKHYALKEYGGVDVWLHSSYPRQ